MKRFPVYIRVEPKKKRKVWTMSINNGQCLIDVDRATGKVVGYEILDCLKIETSVEGEIPA